MTGAKESNGQLLTDSVRGRGKENPSRVYSVNPFQTSHDLNEL